jgi:hypothetical protein
LDGLLQAAAAKASRSVSEEIEHRLDQSFQRTEADLVVDAWRAAHGGATGDLLRAIATAIWLIERRTGKKWNEDWSTACDVQSTIEAVVLALAQKPLTPERVYQIFRTPDDPRGVLKEFAKYVEQHGMSIEPERIEAIATEIYRSNLTRGAALEALQKMGMAPSDAEIAEAAKKAQAEQK